MNPKFKAGDIVRLLPCFNEHISIPGPYWTELMGQDLKISKILDDSTYKLRLNGKAASGIYYQFKNHSFSWCEEFLYQTFSNFLKDEDFEL